MGIRECALRSDAFCKLKEVYDNRDKAAAEWRAGGKKVVGKLGFDVPDELILAAGMMPIQIYADPQKPLTETNKYLEYAFDPMVRAQFEKLVDGTYGSQMDFLAISNSTDIIVRIFLYLRELKRVEPEKNVPDLAFIDWLFTRHRLYQVKNETVVKLFRKQVEEWAGHEVSDADIKTAAAVCNENRQALRTMAELRHGNEVKISGCEALVIIGSGLFMDKKEHTELVRAVTVDAHSWPVLTGKRVFFSGPEQEDLTLYDMIEEAGMIVVGDELNWGDRYYDRDFNQEYVVDRALVDRYMLREFSPKKALVPERVDAMERYVEKTKPDAVIFYTHLYDEAATWDMPAQKKMLDAGNIAHCTFGKMAWPEYKNDDLQRRLTSFAEELSKGGEQ